MIGVMHGYYPAFPLFHMCARYGCARSLQLLLKLVLAQPCLDIRLFIEAEVS